jgi:predicted ATPase
MAKLSTTLPDDRVQRFLLSGGASSGVVTAVANLANLGTGEDKDT